MFKNITQHKKTIKIEFGNEKTLGKLTQNDKTYSFIQNEI